MDGDDARRLAERAQCLGQPSHWFDDTTWNPLSRFAVTEFCFQCPVTELCMRVVNPSRSFFDGVAAGWVWSNGRRVAPSQAPRRTPP